MSHLPNMRDDAKFARRPSPFHYRAAIRTAQPGDCDSFFSIVVSVMGGCALIALLLEALPIW